MNLQIAATLDGCLAAVGPIPVHGARHYHDLGGDYYTRRDPDSALNRIIRQANALGFTVRFDPIQAA